MNFMPGLLHCMKTGSLHMARFIPGYFKRNWGCDLVMPDCLVPYLQTIAWQWFQCDLVTMLLLLLNHRKFFHVGCKHLCTKDSRNSVPWKALPETDGTDIFADLAHS
ncbi:MAG: hypothetical protein U5K27_02740 [Desulfotignum sp.]|nr:hypothetical protein [Desulfotignum sp.]